MKYILYGLVHVQESMQYVSILYKMDVCRIH